MGKFIISNDSTKIIYYYIDYDKNQLIKEYYDIEKMNPILYSYFDKYSEYPWSFDYSEKSKYAIQKAILCALEFEDNIDYYFGESFSILYANNVITINQISLNNLNEQNSIKLNLNDYFVKKVILNLNE